MFYVLDPDHQPHGIVVLATPDAGEAVRVAEEYQAQCGRRVVITVEEQRAPRRGPLHAA